jgi:TonB family protein
MGANKWNKLALAGAALCLLAGTTAWAQTASMDETRRKVKTRVAPNYPELAKRMNVVGKVKLEIVIDPEGRVKSSRVVGGHPLLVAACQDAVKGWKFTPAPEQTTLVVEFEFARN